MATVEVKDLVGIAEPAGKLIETVQAACGAWFEPHRIRRKAKAEAESKIIIAEGTACEEAILSRARSRIAHDEYRSQQNLESIFIKAERLLPDTVSDQPVDSDWTTHFVNESQYTSNDEIQELWARLLVGEIASPGKFTRRTISLVKLLEPNDAKLFTALARFRIDVPQDVIVDSDSNTVKKAGLGFDELSHLDAIGLIQFESLAGFVEEFDTKELANPQWVPFVYHDRVTALKTDRLQRPTKDNEKNAILPLGDVMLTSMGQQLCELVDKEYDEEIYIYLIEYYKEYSPVSVIDIAFVDILAVDSTRKSDI